VPVITVEAPGDASLGAGPASAPRTKEGYARALEAFLVEPAQLATEADRAILEDIDAFSASQRVAFLTGKSKPKDQILARIMDRVDTALANLAALGPPLPIKKVSSLRLATDPVPVAGGGAQATIDFEKFFLVGSRAAGWDTLPTSFFKGGDRSKGVDRAKWLATPSSDRMKIILQFSSLPGTSRHHWGTEVDLNSTEVADWQPGQKLASLGTWLDANAAKVGMLRSYTAGRKGGYSDEAWHFSYAPIAGPLRDRYNAQVNLTKDVIDQVVADFAAMAAARNLTLPPDFASAIAAINISDLVNNVGPGL
jgi:hypothetical protein